MSNDIGPRPSLWDAILTIVIGSTLTYFFFEPIKEGVSQTLKSLLPTGW